MFHIQECHAQQQVSSCSSLSDNRIKTMVSQTENVMIDENTEKIAPAYLEMRTKASFQTLTGLYNSPRGAQTGHMTKCSLSFKPI